MARGALTFSGGGAERVTVNAAASINNMSAFTVLAWVFPTASADLRMIASKDNGTGARWYMTLAVSGNIELDVGRATTQARGVRNDGAMTTTSKWYCVAGVHSTGSAPLVYIGDLSTALADGTYGTSQAGSGAQNDDSGDPFMWGNDGTTFGFPGRISMGAVFGAALSLSDCRSWQKAPRKTVGANTAKMFHRMGKDGADAIEYVGGLTTTVTSATQSDGVPRDQTWARDGASGLYLRAA